MPSGTTPIWRSFKQGSNQKSTPRSSILPEVGASKPVRILMVVDFPAPFGPRKPKIVRRYLEIDAVDRG